MPTKSKPSTKPSPSPAPITPVPSPLSVRELAAVLVKHYGINKGLFDLTIQFKIGIGAVGPDQENLLPGAMIGISEFGLIATDKLSISTVDAAQVNPAKKIPKKSTK